jgi:hypothetical protein
MACNNPNNWMGEMDPYYAYNGDQVDGLTVTDNMPIIRKMCVDSNLIYDATSK